MNVKFSLNDLIKKLNEDYVEEQCFNPDIKITVSKKAVTKKVKAAILPTRKVLKKRYLLVALLVVTITGVSVSAGVTYSLQRAEAIDDTNRHLIGTEINCGSDGITVYSTEEFLNATPSPSETVIPDNRIVSSVEDGAMAPHVIDEFATTQSDNKYICPEIIMINNSMAIYTKEDGSGWQLESGQTISISYELYEGYSYLGIGIIKDGTMHICELRKEIIDKYSYTAEEAGEYYIYLIGASSDYVSLDSGTITVQ